MFKISIGQETKNVKYSCYIKMNAFKAWLKAKEGERIGKRQVGALPLQDGDASEPEKGKANWG